MTTGWVLTGAVIGGLAGILEYRWLRTAAHRRDSDTPHRSLQQAWWVIPAAIVAGALAGSLQGWLTIPAMVYLLGGVLVSWIDMDVHRVPDRVLKILLPLLVAALVIAAAGTGQWGLLVRSALTAGALGGLFLIMALVGSTGLGDVKLAAVTGLMVGTLGWAAAGLALVAAYLVGAGAAVLMLLRGAHRTQHLAFGPAIVAGAAVAVLGRATLLL